MLVISVIFIIGFITALKKLPRYSFDEVFKTGEITGHMIAEIISATAIVIMIIIGIKMTRSTPKEK